MAFGGKERVYNVNVGVLGHVDSGKTSLVAALSTQLSTAALDKHPQSRERGITLDLGFSSFTCPMPSHLKELQADKLQVTLVDCPGHASLIRTIIGGAQIIDMMLLVIDITRGIQAQTAECLVVGEIATDQLLVVLNKVDLLPAENRSKLVARAQKKLLQTFAHTKFKKPSMVAVSARPGGGGEFTEGSEGAERVEEVVAKILELIPDQPRPVEGKFLMSVDHCFAVKGHGTVLTGTVLQGSAKVGDNLELPRLKEQRKVRSMQIFKKSQQQCHQGDRVGICVSQLDPSRVERGWLCTPSTVPTFSAAVAALEKIRFYTGEVRSRQKLHVTVGHVTVMAELQFWGVPASQGVPRASALQAMTSRIGALSAKDNTPHFDATAEYVYQDQMYGPEGRPQDPNESVEQGGVPHYGPQWALLKFSQPVTAPKDSLVVVSRLDDVSTGAACRLALYGSIAALLDPGGPLQLERLKVYKLKRREGFVERLLTPDGYIAVCRGFFKKDSDFSAFIGMKVVAAGGVMGAIESAFGKSGKFRVCFERRLPPPSVDHPEGNKLSLTFKKYVYGDKKVIAQ